MKRNTIRRLHKERPNVALGKALAAYIGGEGGGQGSRWVRGIFDFLQADIAGPHGEWLYPFPRPATDNDDEASAGFAEVYEQWQERVFGGLTFTIAPSMTVRTGRARRYQFDFQMRPTASRSQFTYEDEKALNRTISLARAGLLHRVRRCTHCQSWFFATKNRNFYCSDACRDREFRATPAGREKRRLYMRRYRAQPDQQRSKLKSLKRRKRNESLSKRKDVVV